MVGIPGGNSWYDSPCHNYSKYVPVMYSLNIIWHWLTGLLPTVSQWRLFAERATNQHIIYRIHTYEAQIVTLLTHNWPDRSKTWFLIGWCPHPPSARAERGQTENGWLTQYDACCQSHFMLLNKPCDAWCQQVNVGWHDGGERRGHIDGITNYLYIERFSHTCYWYLRWLWTTHFNISLGLKVYKP